jgi:purine-nucleoside phosphorylase
LAGLLVYNHSMHDASGLDPPLTAAVETLRRALPEPPDWIVVLGSGLGELADEVERAKVLPYYQIPGFPQPRVAGHAGRLVAGRIEGVRVAVLQGRAHFYEGYSMVEITRPVCALAALGARALLATNAAGALNPAYRPGDVMVLRDHIFLPGLAGHSPLRGPAPARGPRFLSLGDAYDPALSELAREAAAEAGLPCHSGVYVMVAGPSYETPAEVRFLRLAGGDAVGMSTIPEVLVARQHGLRVLAYSLISNIAQTEGAFLSHADVLAATAAAAPRLRAMTRVILARGLAPSTGVSAPGTDGTESAGAL